jgi:(2Fe-2S) ferredoxin
MPPNKSAVKTGQDYRFVNAEVAFKMFKEVIKKQTPVETGVDKPKPTAYEKIVRNIFIEL